MSKYSFGDRDSLTKRRSSRMCPSTSANRPQWRYRVESQMTTVRQRLQLGPGSVPLACSVGAWVLGL